MKKVKFNNDWNFSKVHSEKASFNVTLPHDAMIFEGHSADARSGAGGGYYCGGRYCYRKHFKIEGERSAKYLLRFDGIAGESHIYLNAKHIAQNFYAYNGFTVDITDCVVFGEENLIEVYIDNDRQPNSRWYAGSGIYRSVWLITGGEVRIGNVKISTPFVGEDVSEIELEISLENDKSEQHCIIVETEILDRNGKTICREITPFTLFEQGKETARQRLYPRNISLWSTDSPNLYDCRIRLTDGHGSTLDETEESFGFRTITADPVHGLRINGKETLLRGACIHHDNGVIGAAEYYDACERRIRILKEAGFNAVRISHHPCSEEMLSACDKLGMLVWDETFDIWQEHKTKYDFAMYFDEEWKNIVDGMVEKDFNHPCVFLYSIGNEIPEIVKPQGIRVSRMLTERIRMLDRTRLVSNAINGMCAASGKIVPLLIDLGIVTKEQVASITGDPNSDSATVFQIILDTAGKGGNINDAMLALANNMGRVMEHPSIGEKLAEPLSHLDVSGYNYMKSRYEVDARDYPDKIIVGSETTPPDIDILWEKVKNIPQLIGDFTWTGWDYIGEAGVGHTNYEGKSEFAVAYPGYLAYCGDIDITGYRRPMSYLREIVYGLRTKPYISVQDPKYFETPAKCTSWAEPETVASWTWRGSEGKPVRVTVYCADEEIELFLNGRSLGRRTVERNRAVFETVYEPGELKAVGCSGGKLTQSHTLLTASNNVHLELTLSKETIARHTELCFVEMQFADEKGVPDMNNSLPVKVTVSENAELIGFGTGDPKSEEEFDDCVRTVFRGRALAVIRGRKTGRATITVAAGNELHKKQIKII